MKGRELRCLITDNLRNYDAGHRTLLPTVHHKKQAYANNQAEVSDQPTRQQERAMCGFNSPTQTQRFLTLQGRTLNLFRLGRHLLQTVN